jgi:hypothetical protein
MEWAAHRSASLPTYSPECTAQYLLGLGGLRSRIEGVACPGDRTRNKQRATRQPAATWQRTDRIGRRRQTRGPRTSLEICRAMNRTLGGCCGPARPWRPGGLERRCEDTRCILAASPASPASREGCGAAGLPRVGGPIWRGAGSGPQTRAPNCADPQ